MSETSPRLPDAWASGRAPAPLRIGPLVVPTPVELASMTGVINASFRRLCREMAEAALPESLRPSCPGPLPTPDSGPLAPMGLYVTEMITIRALVERNERTLAMVHINPAERVRSIQLHEVDPATVGTAVRILVEEDLAGHTDLNFGYPAPKVTRKGGGVALPWERDLLAAILTEAVRTSEAAVRAIGRARQVPVTMKIRLGIDEEHETLLDVARAAENAGIAAVALHVRSACRHYSGQARWEEIARLKEAADLPVLGNGDVWLGDDAVRMMEVTGCDGVVVGCGCQGRPWLFAGIVAAMHGSPAYIRSDLDAVIKVIRRHGRMLAEEMGEDRGMRDLCKYVGWYLKGYPVGGAARADLIGIRSLDELDAGLARIRSRLPEVVDYPGDIVEDPRGRAGSPGTPRPPDGWLDSPTLDAAHREMLSQAEPDVSGG